MENSPQKKNNRLWLYLIGYYAIGTIWLVIQFIPIPLGIAVGLIRIYRFYKKDNTFKWKLRIVALIIGAILSYLDIGLRIPLNINW